MIWYSVFGESPVMFCFSIDAGEVIFLNDPDISRYLEIYLVSGLLPLNNGACHVTSIENPVLDNVLMFVGGSGTS